MFSVMSSLAHSFDDSFAKFVSDVGIPVASGRAPVGIGALLLLRLART